MLRSIPLLLVLGITTLALGAGLAVGASQGRRPQRPPPDAPAPPPPAHPLEPGPPPPGPPAAGPHPTTHGRLVLDGQFAQRIGLLAALRRVAWRGKTIRHAPVEHLITAFVNVLAGHRQLQQISRGATPLRADRTLAQAWEQPQFPDVSGVCRQLRTVDWATTEAVRTELRGVFAPYVSACQARAQRAGPRLLVDWDLTAKAITTEATSDPFAAYGHMTDGQGKGYQWATAVLRGRGPDGQPRPVALGGFLRPGNAHPPECVERLRQITEATLGQPRRRPEWVAQRLATAQGTVADRRARLTRQQTRLAAAAQRVRAVTEHLDAVARRRAGRRPRQQALVARDDRVQQTLQRRLARAEQGVATAQPRVAAAQAALATAEQTVLVLQQRREQYQADNAALDATHQPGTPIEVLMDAQFGSSALVTDLLEAGYDVTTKATSPATIQRLLRQEAPGQGVFGPWQPVSANAEVADCQVTRYADCPYPLRLLGYRKHLAATAHRPAQTRYALVLTSVPATERAGPATVHAYHQRGGTVELVNRQAKSALGFCGHRLRWGPGLDLLGQFIFAGVNFVLWLADTIWADSDAAAGPRPGLAELMQLAGAPADVLRDEAGVAVQFRPESGWGERRLHLGVVRQLPLPGFVWPGVWRATQLAPPT